ncbi:MAG: sigma-70 family RNA polymerase sigma factor [Oscillospiraceae bacterium]|nr:sigma-70 family RNA polymerase sigma factor [Oscillospiraceae bacterium]
MPEQSFSRIYEQNVSLIYSIAYSYMHNREDAEDMTEEAFVRLLERGHSFPEDAQARAWLITVTRNLCINELRQRRRRIRDERLPEELAHPPAQADADLQSVMQAVNALPEKYRLPLVLFAIEGYSVRETADMLKLNESTVRTRVARARELIRKETGVEGT